MFIRETGANEFENGFDAALQLKLMEVYSGLPKLWILVFGDESLYFTVPVYRGAHFFPVKTCHGLMTADVSNDRSTRILLAEMDSRVALMARRSINGAIDFMKPSYCTQKSLKSNEAIN